MQLRSLSWIAAVTLLITSGSVSADEGAELYKAKGCIACHGEAGISAAPIWPNIAGPPKQYLIAQMKDIKSGERDNGMSVTMQAVMSAVSDEEIEKIADWLSQL